MRWPGRAQSVMNYSQLQVCLMYSLCMQHIPISFLQHSTFRFSRRGSRWLLNASGDLIDWNLIVLYTVKSATACRHRWVRSNLPWAVSVRSVSELPQLAICKTANFIYHIYKWMLLCRVCIQQYVKTLVCEQLLSLLQASSRTVHAIYWRKVASVVRF